MIILLHLDAGPSQREAVRTALDRLGLAVEEVRLGERTAFVASEGDGRSGRWPPETVSRIPGVERVIPLQARAALAQATYVPGGRTVRIGGASFGGGHVGIIAGPCTVEDPAALLRTARLVASAGAQVLRGGAFKTRTSPHLFQGQGAEAVRALRAVSREVGLPFVTELTDPRQVREVGELLDGVQIGSRNMQNVPLLLEVARLGKPVLLKRHMAADVEEWLLAAEYLLEAGNEQVILCERGLKSSDKHVRYLLDVGVVPWLKQRVGLPVIVDPSHAAGDWRLVPALARAAIAAGADGLIVEVHPEPETTRCDAAQALPPADFARLIEEVRALVALLGRGPASKSSATASAAVAGAS